MKNRHIVAIILIIIAVASALYYFNNEKYVDASDLNIISSKGDCEVVPFMEGDKHFQSYDEVRLQFNQDLSDADFNQIGVEQRSDGLYLEVCREVVSID